MGWRFQKRVKVIPGVTINLSKSGVSTSVGVPGARVTLGHGQTRVTGGLPGTGLSQSSVYKNASALPPQVPSTGGWAIVRAAGWVVVVFLGALALMATVIAALFTFSGGKKSRKR